MLQRIIVIGICIFLVINMLGCSFNKEKIIIYTSMETYRLIYLNERLKEEFPEYEIILEYVATGNHAAKLMVEGKETECDITLDLDYGYLMMLDEKGILADISHFDKSIYVEDVIYENNFLPELRSSGCIIINTDLLEKRGLKEPKSYKDLLNPEYKGLISMPSPKASGTGYMFLKSLVNAWGEEEAFAYFDELTPNILQYTSSGSGPLNAILQGEVAIGLGMMAPTVMKINEGKNIKIVYFEEGCPFTLYGQGIIEGKENNEGVREVFEFLINEYNFENNEKFFPEKIYIEKDYKMPNYPEKIDYADMSNNTIEEKERLLEKWKY